MVAKGDNTGVKRSYSSYQISKEDESFSKFMPTIKQAIRTTRRTGSSLILEPKWFANGARRTGSSLILESRLFANVTRIWQRTGYSLILEPRLFAWRLYEGQEPLQLQPGDWIPRMSNISSIVRNPPKWRSKQSCNQVGFFFSWIEWRPRIGWTGRVGNQSCATSGRVERKD